MTTPNKRRSSTGPIIITVLVIVLIILHQDNWLWENETLVFGIIPIGLFFHMGISIAASATWLLATWIAWPIEIIEQASAGHPNDKSTAGDSQ